MTVDRIVLAFGLAMTLAGAALAIAPAPVRRVPANDAAPASPQAISVPAVEKLAALFDLSALPAATSAEAPPAAAAPDPSAALNRYVFLGGAATDVRSRALFENEGVVIALAPGERLEGFALVNFDADAAYFEGEGKSVSLAIRK